MSAKDYNFDPVDNNTKRHVTTGLLNTGVTQIVSLMVQIASIVIMSRLLAPADFGLFAMVSPIYGFVMLFQDVGLNQATVQKEKISHAEINAFFWINIAVGVTLALLLALLSPVVGWYYHDSRVVGLTIGMGLLVLMGSFNNQHNAILRRRMHFGTLSIINMLASVGGLAGSVLWAYFIGGYWALFFGMAITTFVPAVGAWLTSQWLPSAPRIVPGIRGMLAFGAGITGTNVLGFFSRNLDNVLIGHRWGNEQLGLYDRGYKLLMFPLQRIVGPIGGVMIPVMSRLASDPDQYRTLFLKTLGQLTLLVWPGIMWAFVFKDTLIPTLLGKNWVESVPIFGPLALAAFMQVINNPTGWLFITQGRSGDFVRTGIITAVTSIGAFILGLPYGAVGVATAYAISEYIRTPLIWWFATRRGPVQRGHVVKALLPQCISVLASGCAITLFYHAAFFSPAIVCACGCVLSYLVFVLCMLLFPGGRETMQRSLGVVYQLLLRVKS